MHAVTGDWIGTAKDWGTYSTVPFGKIEKEFRRDIRRKPRNHPMQVGWLQPDGQTKVFVLWYALFRQFNRCFLHLKLLRGRQNSYYVELVSFQKFWIWKVSKKVSGNIGSLVKLHQLHGSDCICKCARRRHEDEGPTSCVIGGRLAIRRPCSRTKDFNPQPRLVPIYRPRGYERLGWPTCPEIWTRARLTRFK